MTNEARKRKEKHEDDNWDKYQGIMERNGFTLVFKPDVGGKITPYHNLMMGDGIWLHGDEQTFRDLKICGDKYGGAVSKNSMQNFPHNGVYDFYDPYFGHDTVYSIVKSDLLYHYYNDSECWKQDGDLVRFNFNLLEKYGEKFV